VRRRRLSWSLGAVVVVALAVVLPLELLPSGATKAAAPVRATRHHRVAPRTASPHPAKAPATVLGSDGVEASWVIDQNKLPGTTAWEIVGQPAGKALDGFDNPGYAKDGQLVTFYVSSVAPSYTIDAYRMGYYQGKGARLVWSSPRLRGVVQPACTLTTSVNMVSCDNWAPSLRLRLTKAFIQGDYLFKLTGSGGQQSYIELTVWDPAARGAYLIKNDTFTWEEWNDFGGYDFYSGLGSCPANHYPLCSRARIVSFDRPYDYGDGAGDFLTNEYPLVRFMEKHGLDVGYATDLTIEQHPSILTHYATLLSLGHDEAWAYHERLFVENEMKQRGMNVIFFGASAMLRHVRMQSSPLGPDREEVDYRNSAKDPLDGKGNPLEVTGNTWGSPPANWPESNFVGEMYAGYTGYGVTAQPFVVADAAAFVFAGTGLKDGSKIPGVILSDFDHFDPDMAHPADVQILGHSPLPINDVETDLGDFNGVTYSDMTYYTDPTSHAGVFDSGTNNWIFSLRPCTPGETACPAPILRRITGNLLRVFGQGPAGLKVPSVANFTQFYP
jgi:hypothetical protein